MCPSSIPPATLSSHPPSLSVLGGTALDSEAPSPWAVSFHGSHGHGSAAARWKRPLLAARGSTWSSNELNQELIPMQRAALSCSRTNLLHGKQTCLQRTRKVESAARWSREARPGEPLSRRPFCPRTVTAGTPTPSLLQPRSRTVVLEGLSQGRKEHRRLDTEWPQCC